MDVGLVDDFSPDLPCIPWDVIGLIVAELPFKTLARTALVSKRWFTLCKRAVGPRVCLVTAEHDGPVQVVANGCIEVSLNCECARGRMPRTVGIIAGKVALRLLKNFCVTHFHQCKGWLLFWFSHEQDACTLPQFGCGVCWGFCNRLIWKRRRAATHLLGSDGSRWDLLRSSIVHESDPVKLQCADSSLRCLRSSFSRRSAKEHFDVGKSGARFVE